MAQRIMDKGRDGVKMLPVPPKGNRITYDSEVRGFGVRVTAGGSRAFVVNYRINGRERRYTIGQWPDWSVGAARDEAKRIKRDVDLGIDVLGDRNAARDAPTMADLCDDYLERHAGKKRTGREDRRKIDNRIKPRLGRRMVADVTTRDVEDLHHSMKATPCEANRVIALVSTMFSMAVKWGWRTDNPCRGIEKFHEAKRERYLSPVEIARLVAALDDSPHKTAANVVRLLLLTGARRGEVLKATWDQFNLDTGVWIKPSAHTKTKKEHRVPLSPPAVELLARLHKGKQDEFVFPGKKPGAPLTEVKRPWADFCKAAELEDVHLHDLRHTYASMLVSSGLSLPIIGALLGHTQVQTTQRYAHLADDPLREATKRVGAIVEALGKGGKSGEIVKLHEERG